MSNSFISQVSEGAIRGWQTHKILPSIAIAQACLESGWGKSKLALPPNHNLFGIKWSADYSGEKVNMLTTEYGSSGQYQIYADFRVYPSWKESMLDHSAFFTNTPWREQNYKAVVGETDYKKASRALQNAGYATDPSYASKLIKIIEDNKLYEYDTIKDNTTPTTPAPKQPVNKTVGGILTNASRDASKDFNVTLIADSLGVGTYPHLQNVFKSFNHDSKGSRQFTHTDPTLNATTVLNNMKNADTLKDIIVVVLGTNRGVEQSELNNFMAIAGSEKKVIFVNTASEVTHRATVALRLKQASLDHANAYYVDWMSHAMPLITSYYQADGAGGTRVHMTTTGYQKHAEYIRTAIYEASQQRVLSSSGSSAQSVIKEYVNIRDVELKEDGAASYTVDGQTQVIHTGTEGLTSPLGDEYIYNTSANKSFGFYKDDKILWVEGTHESAEEENPLNLMNLASKDLAERSIPAIHYTVDLAYLPDTVSIGDRGIIIDHEFNPPLYIEARVLEIQTSDTDPSANYVLIGNVIELFPEDKSDIIKLQQGLQETRENLLDEYRKGEPLVFSIESSSDEIFSEETTLGMKVTKGANTITESFDRFVWERESSDNAKDNLFNQMLKETGQTTNYINIREVDVLNAQSTFRCTVYDGKTLVGSATISMKVAKEGKSAYELAVEAGFSGSLVDWIESLKGSDGSDGISGSDGEDGRTSYTHIAYSNSSDGTVDFTTARHVDKEYTYFGIYVDFNEEDSQNPADYEWLYFKGKTTYLFVAYADSEDGTVNFSTKDSLNKKYIGMYSSTEVEQSLNPADYSWTETAGHAEENAKNYAHELAQWNEEQINQVRVSLQEYNFSLDGKTTMYRGIHAPIGMKEGDIWYRPHPEIENERQMLVYNGELWEIVADTSGISLLTEQMETVKEETQDARDRANEAYTKAETAENALVDKVSTDEYESTISQIEDNINLRVEKGDIVNQINISDEDILIDASKIHLSGDITVDGSFKVTGDMIAGTISADKLQGGTINGSKMNIVDINADSITSGKLVIHEDFGIWSRGELRKILYGIDLAKDKRIALHTSHLMDYGCAIYWIEGEDGIHRLEVEVHVEDDIIQVQPEDVLWYERRSESRSDTITYDEWIENVYQIGTGTSLTLTSDILSRKNVIIVDWIKGKKTNIMEVGE